MYNCTCCELIFQNLCHRKNILKLNLWLGIRCFNLWFETVHRLGLVMLVWLMEIVVNHNIPSCTAWNIFDGQCPLPPLPNLLNILFFYIISDPLLQCICQFEFNIYIKGKTFFRFIDKNVAIPGSFTIWREISDFQIHKI